MSDLGGKAKDFLSSDKGEQASDAALGKGAEAADRATGGGLDAVFVLQDRLQFLGLQQGQADDLLGELFQVSHFSVLSTQVVPTSGASCRRTGRDCLRQPHALRAW